jgi:outer membrane receptor for ferrienterochelin and colicins
MKICLRKNSATNLFGRFVEFNVCLISQAKCSAVLLVLCLSFSTLKSQNTFQAQIRDSKSNETLAGVSGFSADLKIGGVSDSTGSIALRLIPDGSYSLQFSFTGYKTKSIQLSFPLKQTETFFTILLEPNGTELTEVIVSSTRTNSRIEDIPIRVEVLGSEEVNEEIEMKPSNISKLLGETSGIQTQQTSATSGSMSFRILGLPGKYTQLLKDGFPVYSGFSAGLSLLQIPPLDLKQVEVIKGSSSALYGGDAIAGLVNLISKTPEDSTQWTVLVNQTHKGGSDISSFFSGKKKKLGLTFLATASNQVEVDVNGDGFSDIPKLQQYTLNPKLFYYINPSSTLTVGLSSSYENRIGGDMKAIQGSTDTAHSFFEKHVSHRTISQLLYEKKFDRGNTLVFKNSFNDFNRTISSSGALFSGEQFGSYSELSFLMHIKKHKVVVGGNYNTDAFTENKTYSGINLGYTYQTLGVFVQDDWKLTNKVQAQAGIRADYHNSFGPFVLPRLSALYKITPALSCRLGGGLGYKAPSVFTEEAEAQIYKNVLPLSKNLQAENSAGANFDINYRKALTDELRLSINQSFNYTVVRQALIPQADSLAKGRLVYQNAPGDIVALGSETNVKLKMDETELSIGYTYLDVQKQYDKIQPNLEFTPKSRLVMSLVFGEENNWRIGLEEFYTGSQYLPDGSKGRDFWISGAIAEKVIKRFTLVANVENLFDFRQSRYERIVHPPFANPSFRPIYAPLDGIVVNVAIKIRIY